MEDWKDLLIEPSYSTGMPPILAGGMPAKPTRLRLAITLHLPQTPAFVKALSHEQKTMYTKRWHLIKNALGMDHFKDGIYFFEHFESGHVHLHGTLYFEFPGKISQEGAIADIVKTYLRTLPAKYAKYNGTFMTHFKDGITYKCASCCIKTLEGEDNIMKWDTYIRKDQ